MSYVNNYIDHNRLHYAKEGLYTSLESFDGALYWGIEEVNLEGFSDIVKWVKDTFKKIWEWFKGLWNKFLGMLRRWLKAEVAITKIEKVTEYIDRRIYTEQNLKDAVIALFDHYEVLHFYSPFHLLEPQNGKFRDINILLKNTKHAIDQLGKVSYEPDNNTHPDGEHVFINGKPAEYRSPNGKTVPIKDIYFDHARLGSSWFWTIERCIFGLKPNDEISEDAYMADQWVESKALIDKVKLDDFKAKLNTVSKDYANVDKYYTAVANGLEKIIKTHEDILLSNKDNIATKDAKIRGNLAKFIVRFSMIPVYAVSMFIQLVDRLTNNDAINKYLTTDKCPASKIFHLTDAPTLPDIMLPRNGGSNLGELLPPRISFGRDDEILKACVGLPRYFDYTRSDVRNETHLDIDEGSVYRYLYLYEPSKRQDNEIRYLKQEVVDAGHTGLLNHHYGEVCVTTPIRLERKRILKIWFVSGADQFDEGKFIKYEEVTKYGD